LPIRIKVVVAGDEMTIDYSGIAEQVKGPINSGWFGAQRPDHCVDHRSR